jgi:hypothetical protein
VRLCGEPEWAHNGFLARAREIQLHSPEFLGSTYRAHLAAIFDLEHLHCFSTSAMAILTAASDFELLFVVGLVRHVLNLALPLHTNPATKIYSGICLYFLVNHHSVTPPLQNSSATEKLHPNEPSTVSLTICGLCDPFNGLPVLAGVWRGRNAGSI